MVTLVNLNPQLDEARIEPGEDLHPLTLRDKEYTTHMGLPWSRMTLNW